MRKFGPFKATLVRVKDGDTILMDIEPWPGDHKRVSIRLDRVDTPEKRSRQFCEREMAFQATEFTKRFLSGREIIVRNLRRGKYSGRMVADIEADGKDLADALVQAGLGRPYDGGKRGPWCED